MNRSELINVVAERAHVDPRECEKVMRVLTETITEQVARGEKITISGFGTFEIRERAERQGINPRTREPITIAASKSIVFKPGKALKDTL